MRGSHLYPESGRHSGSFAKRGMQNSLPEFLHFNLLGKTILVATNVRTLFGQSTRSEVRKACSNRGFARAKVKTLTTKAAEYVPGAQGSSPVPSSAPADASQVWLSLSGQLGRTFLRCWTLNLFGVGPF